MKMQKKVTFTLEEGLVEKLASVSAEMGKKKTQIVREALNDYFNRAAKADRIERWKRENRAAMDHYNERVEEEGTFSDGIRSF
jgi:antitoxin CcdA